MATDLTKVNDHPAALLETGNLNDVKTEVDAARALRRYEQDRGVTFAALDNEALARVREAYDRANTVRTDDRESALSDFQDAVSDLLGLSD